MKKFLISIKCLLGFHQWCEWFDVQNTNHFEIRFCKVCFENKERSKGL